MPSYFPEDNAPGPQDDIRRSLQKINDRLYDMAACTLTYFPEGCAPGPQDTVWRSLQKINNLLNNLTVGGSAAVTVGDGNPNGVVVGTAEGMLYVDRLTGDLYIFLGTIGTDTGWV